MILDYIFLVQIIFTLIISIIFCFYDVKRGFLPNRLNYILAAFGFLSNLILTIITANIKFIFFSIISYSITYVITLLLWELNVWGGGDVKLLASIAAVIPFGINSSFFIMVNSILVSFPFLLVLLIYLIVKNDIFNDNAEVFKGFVNYRGLKILIDASFNRHINITDLKEGMMINNFYFDSDYVKYLIESNTDTNLKVFKSDDDNSRYYFKTLTAGGITKKDMYLLKIMNAQEIISNQISIKLGFPFVPAIFVGLILAIFYGDLSMIILKNLIFVI